jgi:hypothetical protein
MPSGQSAVRIYGGHRALLVAVTDPHFAEHVGKCVKPARELAFRMREVMLKYSDFLASAYVSRRKIRRMVWSINIRNFPPVVAHMVERLRDSKLVVEYSARFDRIADII